MAEFELRSDLNAGELDCLRVLWQVGEPLKLAQIHKRVLDLRANAGEAPAALTTVSTYLRQLVAKGLLREVTIVGEGQEGVPQTYVRTRGLIPTSRSPRTGYVTTHQPGDVLCKTFRALADAYPSDRRFEALIDFARALELPEKIIERLRHLVEGA